MTEQERPRTEAGRDALSFLRLDVWRDAILAIEAESRQQAVREAKQQLKDADGPVEFQSAVWYSEVEGILDRVAGLNASETMHDAFCILSRDHGGACDIPGLNASESPRPTPSEQAAPTGWYDAETGDGYAPDQRRRFPCSDCKEWFWYGADLSKHRSAIHGAGDASESYDHKPTGTLCGICASRDASESGQPPKASDE